MPRLCRECGQPFEPKRQGRGLEAVFCSEPCKKSFGNRRMLRGAQLYDMFMILRYERGLAKLRGIWALTCELARIWRAEDIDKRGGRPSWRPYEEMHDALLPLRVTVLASKGVSAGQAAFQNSIAARSRAN